MCIQEDWAKGEQVKYLLVKVNGNDSIQAHRRNFFLKRRLVAKKKGKKKK